MGETINAQGSQGFVNQPSGPVNQTFNTYEAGYTLPSPRQIPTPPADFVGREAELADLCAAVEHGGAIITGIHGLGGIGKTALACKLAEALKERYPDGSLMLDLRGPDAPIPPEMILDRFIHAFYPTAKLPEDLPSLQALYRQVLSGKRLILLLDNARGPEQVAPLLPPPAGCLALVTSRVHITSAGMRDINLEVLPEPDAVNLLLAIEPGIGPAAPALAKACAYLPLALTVIGSLLHEQTSFTPADALLFMEDEAPRLELSGVEASLEASYRMLPEDLQAQWRKLAVFAGDFAVEPVLQVWGRLPDNADEKQSQRARVETKRALGRLQAYSLVEHKDGRYRLHDLARIFAVEKMSKEALDAARLAHTRYFIQYLSMCNQRYMLGGVHVAEAVALFDCEVGEISAAQRWCAEKDTANASELCSEFPNAGVYILNLRLHPREWIRWLENGLRAARQLGDRAMEGNHLGNLGLAYAALGKPRRAIAYYEQRLVIARETGDRRGEGNALGNLGTAYKNLGEPRRAIAYYEQTLVIARETGDRRGEGNALGSLGTAYKNLGEPRRAIAFYEQQLAITREIGDRRGEGSALGNLGSAYADLGEPRRAIAYHEQHLEIACETGDRRGEGSALCNLGITYANLGEPRRAIENYEQALVILREIGDRGGEANTCWNLGLTREEQGDLAGAVKLMQFLVDYERELGHLDAEKHAADVAQLHARMAQGGEAGQG